MSDDGEVVQRFIQEVGADLANQGFPRMPALVLLALMSSETGRLTSAEIGAELGVSAAAISGAVKYLQLVGFIRVLTEPGGRKHVYSIADTPWYTASLRAAPRFQENEVRMREAAFALASRPAAQQRIEELADFYAFMGQRLPELLREWNEQRAADAG
ncbi:GbsR/MarR family transcriptional regulator [Pseudolysinimonas sp.]|uniref:GbsR/MarR family transcriptional regulator n=1 Tax=Pseudolysinimonas sp. TaxID=2680009 RepID=UPI003F81143B